LFEAAHNCAAAGQFTEALAHCRAILRIQSNFTPASILLAMLLRQIPNIDEAIRVLQSARAAAPDDPEVLAYLRQLLGSGRVPMWHFSMMNDMPRNQAYEQAIRATVKSGDHVLEIGTGSGLLAMMAARAGAAHVNHLRNGRADLPKGEPNYRNRMALRGRVTVIAKESTSLQATARYAGPADVLVAEVISMTCWVKAC
jgi:tetratricopeptide (TPR) repeat protein